MAVLPPSERLRESISLSISQPPAIKLNKQSLHYRQNTDDDRWVIPELIDLNMYRFEHLAALEPDVPCAVLDCGAHIGIFSLLAALYFRNSEIHAFEPQPDNYDWLLKNSAKYESIIPHCLGVGPRDAEVDLYRQGSLDDNFSGRWTITPPVPQNTSDCQRVKIIDLDRFILSLNRPVFVLKLDLEGFEAEVIHGLSFAALKKVKVLIIEEHHLPVDHERIRASGFLVDFHPFGSSKQFVYWNRDFWRELAALHLGMNDKTVGRDEGDQYRVYLETLEKDRDQMLGEARRLSQLLEEIKDDLKYKTDQLWTRQQRIEELTNLLRSERERTELLAAQLQAERAQAESVIRSERERTELVAAQLQAERARAESLLRSELERTELLDTQLRAERARAEGLNGDLESERAQTNALQSALARIVGVLGIDDVRRAELRVKELKSEVECLKRSPNYRLGHRLRRTWPMRVLRRFRHRRLLVEIHALGQKNPASHGSQVWLLGIRTSDVPNGIPLHSIDYEQGKWRLVDDKFAPHAQSLMTDTEAEIEIYATRDENLRLDFLMHDWSGQMAIKVAGQYMVFDLYAHTHQAISVYPYHSPLKLVPLESPTLNDLPIPISRPPLNQRFNNPLPLIGKAYDRLLRRSPDRFSQVIYNAPALMAPQERVLLYSLVFAVDPERCLEIGTNRGGSAAIIVAALDDLGGDGRLVCVDPERLFSEELWADIQHRAVFVQGASPLALAGIDRLAGGPFDVVNIDGLHDYDHTLADARGVLPYLADEAYILFHDAYYYEVEQAVDQFLRENNGILTDSGVLSHSPNPEEATPERVWGGIRVLRFRKSQAPS